MLPKATTSRAGQTLFTIDSQQGLESGGTLASALMASLDAQIQLINPADRFRTQADRQRNRPARRGDRERESAAGGHRLAARPSGRTHRCAPTSAERACAALSEGQRHKGRPAAAGRHSPRQPAEPRRSRPAVRCEERELEQARGCSASSSRAAKRAAVAIASQPRGSRARADRKPRRAARRSCGRPSTDASPRCKINRGQIVDAKPPAADARA